MIVGVGIDVVDVARFVAQLERAPGLRRRLFTAVERGLPSASLAARFAAKEAVGHFLDAKRDGGAFRRKLEQALKDEGAVLDLDDGGKAAPAKPPGKPRRGGRIV